MNLLKGLLMILLGAALLFFPEFTMVSVARLVAAFLIVKGTLTVFVYLFSRSAQKKSSLLFELLFDLGIGLIILYNPGKTISFFVIILAIWALIGGFFMAFSFNSLRRIGVTSWGLFFNSIVTLTFGLALIFKPLRGGFALASVIGVFALLVGLINLLFVITDRS